MAAVKRDYYDVLGVSRDADEERIRNYSGFLRTRLAEVVGAALGDLKPAWLEYAVGRATFAMNRRVVILVLE